MEFKEIISQVTKVYKDRSEDLERKKQLWIQEVNKLYDEIGNWLDEYIQSGDIIVDFDRLKFAECEEFMMNISMMYLFFGSTEGPSVIFEPTGINVVGAFGKIDLYFRGHKEDSVFLLLTENKSHWEIWKSRKQEENIKKLTKESFEELIGEWLKRWTDI
ncbi:MAG: hypothetical protein V2I97_04425 [Desulfococcaceae bacterium]|jgi:hypothetical protein|nr:hypothetical protein [Desulfococcaceae bacterium]